MNSPRLRFISSTRRIFWEMSRQYSSFIRFLKGTITLFIPAGFWKLSSPSPIEMNRTSRKGKICSRYLPTSM